MALADHSQAAALVGHRSTRRQSVLGGPYGASCPSCEMMIYEEPVLVYGYAGILSPRYVGLTSEMALFQDAG